MTNRCTKEPHFLHTKRVRNTSEVGAVGEALALSSWQHCLSPDVTKSQRLACAAHLWVAARQPGGASLGLGFLRAQRDR